MPEFCELWAGGPLFAQAEHFRLGTDCVLLADFIRLSSARRGIDLGCASGALMLLLLARSEGLHMTGVELLEEAAALARENMRVNALADRSAIVCGDLRAHRALFCAGSFDLVAANPPYFPVGSGACAKDSGRAGARGEADCTIEDICACARWLLRTGGTLSIVHRPERLCDIFAAMRANDLEPKRLRHVQYRADSAPSLVLIEARHGGRPGLSVEAPLILRGADGGESAEYKRIYHR